MSSGDENFSRNVTIDFRGVKHEVEIIVEKDEILIIQVENSDTLDQWTGKYDVSYIEELSHKTGNFKQFSIFCSMLESALLQNSESVSLDLLTYEDLKILREQKLGKRKHKQVVDNKLQTKRYLIMTYTVEFDQIHYPLPLTYIGSSDPGILKSQIRELKDEVQTLKRNSQKHNSLHKTEANYEMIVHENKELKEELAACHLRLKEVVTGNVAKELKVLKKVVQNLETDLLKERSKHQRIIAKKRKEYDQLIEQLEELKANERNYRVRCKSLTEELAMMKKNSRLSPIVTNRKTRYNSTGSAYHGRKDKNMSRDRRRSHSNSSNRGRSITRSTSRDRDRSGSASSLRRTPSPGYQRFDPSAYVKERDRKRKETDINRSRRRTPSSNSKRNGTPTSHSYLTKPPSGGIKERVLPMRSASRDRRSSAGSDTDSISRLKPKTSNSTKRSANRKHAKATRSDTSDDEYYERKIPRARVKSLNRSNTSPVKDYTREDNESASHSIGIAEIDARLEALQRFMKENMD